MGVLDRLPENRPVTDLKDARQLARERKAMQRVGGSSVRYHRIDNSGTWLWNGRLDTQSAQDASSGLGRFLVTLTSSTSAAFLSSIVVEVETSTNGTTWTAQRSVTSAFGYNWHLQEAGVIQAEPYKAKYDLDLKGAYMDYRRFKVQALSSDPVSISVTRVL